MFRGGRGRRGPSGLDVAQAHVEGDGATEEGDEGPLLELVVEDGGVAFSGGAHRETTGGIAEGNGQTQPGTASHLPIK